MNRESVMDMASGNHWPGGRKGMKSSLAPRNSRVKLLLPEGDGRAGGFEHVPSEKIDIRTYVFPPLAIQGWGGIRRSLDGGVNGTKRNILEHPKKILSGVPTQQFGRSRGSTLV